VDFLEQFEPPPEMEPDELMADGTLAEQQAGDDTIDPRFDEERLGKFTTDLQRDLTSAMGAKVQIDERTRRYRAYMALDRPPPAYAGAPNHVVPYARAKVKGATAQFRGALDLDPFFITAPYTEEAAQNQPVWEVLMERELDRSDSQRQIFLALEEACTTGTGIVQLGVTQPFDEPLIYLKAVKLEDFFAAPTGVEDISRVSTFYRFFEPWHIIYRRVLDGEYSEMAVDRVKTQSQTAIGYDEKQDGSRVFSYSGDNRLHELFECYFRWGDEEAGIPHTLWRVIYHHVSSTILRLEESPFIDCYDAPPYVPVRPMPRIGYFFGESYLQVLEGVQNIHDFALNAGLAYLQYAITPSVFVDEDSPAYNLLTRQGLAPGKPIPVRGAPRDQMEVYNPPDAMNAWRLMEVARSLGDDATFHDLQLSGIPTNTVRSATEISQVSTQAQKKLSEDLSNISHDLSVLARMTWAMIYTFKVEPAGIMPVFQGSKQYVIAASEMSQEELLQNLVEFMAAQDGTQLAPEEQAALVEAMAQQVQGAQLFISTARRDDMEWRPNGGQLVADKVLRAGKLERLIAGMLPAMDLARRDKAVWHLYKAYLQALDIHNWEDFLPPEPPEMEAGPEEFAALSQQMQNTKQGGGTG
jgi:hypothetical protein